MNTHELFPETLLVSREGEHIYTTSRRVAWHFGKRHTEVLRSTQKLIADLSELDANRLKNEPVNEANAPKFGVVNGRNFASIASRKPEGGLPNFGETPTFADTDFWLSEYTDERNRQKPEYLLSHDGFALLTMGFTGMEALYWKRMFLRQFRQMESELADHHARRIAALDTLHPNLLPTVEDCERGLPRCITAQRLGRSVAAVTYHRRKARRLGLLAAPAARGQG